MHRRFRSKLLFSAAAAAFLTLGSAACAPPSQDEVDGEDEAPVTGVVPHPFNIGVNEWLSEMPYFEQLRAAAGTPASEPRLCHVYTYWDVAHRNPSGAGDTHTLAGLLHWFGQVEATCDEVMVTFQGAQEAQVEPVPSASAFESAFVDFMTLTEAGGALGAWRGKLSFTPWNEPNNEARSGNGLGQPMSAETAAHFYLVMRRHCGPAEACKVAAGDLATDGGTAADVEWNCADDTSPRNTPERCEKPSAMNTGSPPKAPSYLDRYKNYIALHATEFGLRPGFRPEYFAYHPWHDVNSYLESGSPCSNYQDCVTRRLLKSLGGSWSRVEIWDNEIGVGLQTHPAPARDTTQPCGAAFLVQLTDLSPRISRVYYMRFEGGDGPLFDGPAIRPAGSVLAHHQLAYAHASCPNTGIRVANYQNPIIPKFLRPAGVSHPAGAQPTEGCPDPMGLKTRGGEFYVYCTSYTFPGTRLDGFPIFKAGSLADAWTRVGSLIPDRGQGRSSWPRWVKDGSNKPFGLFWAPDVHELPSGKFVATYAAPCGHGQCIGMATADGPAGPWTHAQVPLVSPSNNGVGHGSTYDPNLLVVNNAGADELYLYWAVAGAGVFGAQVDASSGGDLSFRSAPQKVMAWGQFGAEGPYVIKHQEAYYLFYSTARSGHLVYDYEVHVRRAASPLAAFEEEGPVVLHHSNAAGGGALPGVEFVAPGGNSIIQDAFDGVDFIVYHAIKVGPHIACPRSNPEGGGTVPKASWNPYCRTQGDRQAMIDPIQWKSDGNGGEWPAVNDGTPSRGRTLSF